MTRFSEEQDHSDTLGPPYAYWCSSACWGIGVQPTGRLRGLPSSTGPSFDQEGALPSTLVDSRLTTWFGEISCNRASICMQQWYGVPDRCAQVRRAKGEKEKNMKLIIAEFPILPVITSRPALLDRVLSL